MIIKCPQCAARYKIPDSSIGAKPRRLRCAKCKKAFIVARKVSLPPRGLDDFEYEELSPRESSSLPEEFGFLTRTSIAPPAEKPDLPPSSSPAPPRQDAPQATVESDSAEPDIPIEESPEQPQAAPDEGRASVVQEWEEEDPFDLTGFDFEQQNERAKKIGKAVTAGFMVFALFFIFVAYRNGWRLSMPKLGDQIAFAFGGGDREDIPDAALGLEAFVDSRQTILGPDKRVFLTAVGGVINNDSANRSQIILRGRLFDASGDLRKEVRAPCGHKIPTRQIKATEAGKMDDHYRKNGAVRDCSIKANSSGAFQLVFEDLPADYDSSFEIEVVAVYAK